MWGSHHLLDDSSEPRQDDPPVPRLGQKQVFATLLLHLIALLRNEAKLAGSELIPKLREDFGNKHFEMSENLSLRERFYWG